MPVHVGVCVCSVAAQEEGVAGCSSQTVAQPADARTVFQGAAFAHVALRDTDEGLKLELRRLVWLLRVSDQRRRAAALAPQWGCVTLAGVTAQTSSHLWNHTGFFLQGVSHAAVILIQDPLIQEFLQRVSLHTHTYTEETQAHTLL